MGIPTGLTNLQSPQVLLEWPWNNIGQKIPLGFFYHPHTTGEGREATTREHLGSVAHCLSNECSDTR